MPDLSETLLIPDKEDAKAIMLEADELWSFVLKKENPVWVWIVLCRKICQVIAYAIGDRSKDTCQNYGNLFLKHIVQDIVILISGVLIRQ